MILYISSIIIFLFVSVNLFFKTAWPAWIKLTGTILLFLISCKYLVYQYLGGAFFAPDLPRTVLIIYEALYGSLIILFFLLLLWDLYLVGNWILDHCGIPIPRQIPASLIKIGLGCLALALGCWGTWQAVKVPDVKTVQVKVSSLPDDLDGFVIVQLTDLHIGPILKKDWLEQVVAKANAQNPDIVVLTGDYIDGRAEDIADELAPLADLKSKYGIFGVTGNHEYYWNVQEWIEQLKNFNVTMLQNEHQTLQINKSTLVIAGIPDLAAIKFAQEKPDLQKAFSGAPDTAIKILLAHQPRIMKEASAYTDLQLSGHTHGGIMFFLQPLIARFNNGFVQGLYQENDKNVYVSPGTGLWNGFSNRIGVRAEITRLVLVKG